ncbi:exotoxin A-like protein [Collimonas sp. PA-H2]|uniref:Exotoxin A-like protein n=1 Tax=Collimonas sp. PA-H2 TaxID=1881062 RepID=A0ACD6BA49_9BURK|nr:exotoxin A binding domain-containing protein [Collimonas sp. PA-H2]PFH04378.1 exotoxin A-like protein [Collimonas sp. PA-H2]
MSKFMSQRWIYLFGWLFLLGTGSTRANTIEGNFRLWDDCSSYCLVYAAPHKIYQTPLATQAVPDSPGKEGVLHYSMVMKDYVGNGQVLALRLDDFATVFVEQESLRLSLLGSDGKPRNFQYARQGAKHWSLNWLVPVGDDAPTSIKVFFKNLDGQNNILSISPLYSVEVDDKTLARWPALATFSVTQENVTQGQGLLGIRRAGVSYVAAPVNHDRHKRWSEWHSGKLLCLLDPLDAIYNYVSQNRCSLGETWEGAIYQTLAGRPVDKYAPPASKPVISQRIHFAKGNALEALTSHRVCGIPLESLARRRKPRGWEEWSSCGNPAANFVALYIATRLPFDQFRQVIHNLVHGQAVAAPDPVPLDALRTAVIEQPELARQSIAQAADIFRNYQAANPGASAAAAQQADVLAVTCPADARPCGSGASSGVLVQRENPTGAHFLNDGELPSFTVQGTQNWNLNRLQAAHLRLQVQGYVFAGYHGTSLEGAQSIVFGGIHNRQQDLEEIWRGLYVAGDPALAYGYAQDAEGDERGRIRNGTMLRVYVPRSALPRLFATSLPLDHPGASQEVARLIGHPLPLLYESITGPEAAGGNRLETILGWQLAEQAVAIPSMIPTNSRTVGNPLDPATVTLEEKQISSLPGYATKPAKDDKTEL